MTVVFCLFLAASLSFLTSNTLQGLDKPRPPPVLEMLGTRWPRGGHVTPASSVSSPGNGPADGRRRLQHEQDLPTGGAQGAPDLLRSVRSSSRAGVPGLHSHLLLVGPDMWLLGDRLPFSRSPLWLGWADPVSRPASKSSAAPRFHPLPLNPSPAGVLLSA